MSVVPYLDASKQSADLSQHPFLAYAHSSAAMNSLCGLPARHANLRTQAPPERLQTTVTRGVEIFTIASINRLVTTWESGLAQPTQSGASARRPIPGSCIACFRSRRSPGIGGRDRSRFLDQ